MSGADEFQAHAARQWQASAALLYSIARSERACGNDDEAVMVQALAAGYARWARIAAGVEARQ